MHFINVHGPAEGIRLLPGFHPFAVVPLIAGQVPELAAVAGPQLHFKAVGIGPHVPFPVGAEDIVFIGAQQLFLPRRKRVIRRPEQGVRQPQLPDAVILLDHGIGFRVPAAEAAHKGDALGVGRPDGEMPFQLPVLFHGMRAQEVIRVRAVPGVKTFPSLAVRRIVPHRCKPPCSFFILWNDYITDCGQFARFLRKRRVDFRWRRRAGGCIMGII